MLSSDPLLRTYCKVPQVRPHCLELVDAVLGTRLHNNAAQRHLINGARRVLACRSLDASLVVHGKFFLQQQAAERAFLAALPRSLCDNLPAAPAARLLSFQAALHARVQPLRDATNRHVHAAFFFKAACNALHDEVGIAEIERLSGAHVPAAQAANVRHPIISTPEPLFCSLPILQHEEYNLAEGDFVANLTNSLLLEGPETLCGARGDAGGLLLGRVGGDGSDASSLAERLEVVMRRHRSDASFEEVQAAYAPFCEAAAATAAAEPVIAEALEALPPRTFEEATEASLYEPCAPTDRGEWRMRTELLIDIFGNDTLFLLGETKRALLDELSFCHPGRCSCKVVAAVVRWSLQL